MMTASGVFTKVQEISVACLQMDDAVHLFQLRVGTRCPKAYQPREKGFFNLSVESNPRRYP